LKPVVDRNFVYALIDPRTGEPRYVGQTSKGMMRPQSHKIPSVLRKRPAHFRNWVNEMRRNGVTYSITVLERFPSSEPSDEAEIRWIRILRSQGYRLINYTDGGGGIRGWKHSVKTKQQFSKTRKGKKLPPRSKKHREHLALAMVTSVKAKAARDRAHEARRGVRPSQTAIDGFTKFSRKPRSESHKANIAKALRGKKKSPEHAQKCRENLAIANLRKAEQVR
jgi:hypothetical protein